MSNLATKHYGVRRVTSSTLLGALWEAEASLGPSRRENPRLVIRNAEAILNRRGLSSALRELDNRR